MGAVDPPRSRFFSVAPIGVGTPQVESLDGYLCRLAAKHRVRPSALRRRLAEETELSGCTDPKPWPQLLERIGPSSAWYARCLARLTLRPEVAMLGLANLACHVSPVELLASKNAWCPHCLREMLTAGQFYVPQAWRLHCYTHCTRHAQRLLAHCPHCYRSTSALDSWFAAMGTCHWCRRSLLTESADSNASTWTDEVVSSELESLCAALSGDFGDPYQPLLEPASAWVMREARRHGLISGIEATADMAGISAKLLNSLEHHKESNTSLQTLVRICVAAGVSVEGALRRNFPGFRGQPLLVPLQHASITYRAKRAIGQDQVRREVIALLRSGQLPTMTQLQLRFGLQNSRLNDLLTPKLRERLKHRHALHRKRLKQRRFAALVDTIVATRTTLLVMCQPAQAEHVAAALGRRRAATPNFLAAFAQAMLASA